jgi:hypothetical protein
MARAGARSGPCLIALLFKFRLLGLGAWKFQEPYKRKPRLGCPVRGFGFLGFLKIPDLSRHSAPCVANKYYDENKRDRGLEAEAKERCIRLEIHHGWSLIAFLKRSQEGSANFSRERFPSLTPSATHGGDANESRTQQA